MAENPEVMIVEVDPIRDAVETLRRMVDAAQARPTMERLLWQGLLVRLLYGPDAEVVTMRMLDVGGVLCPSEALTSLIAAGRDLGLHNEETV